MPAARGSAMTPRACFVRIHPCGDVYGNGFSGKRIDSYDDCAMALGARRRKGCRLLQVGLRCGRGLSHRRSDGNVVARLSVDGAEFWVSDGSPEHGKTRPATSSETAVRMILTVADPDAIFALAVQAGAFAIHPVSEEHGWRVGRVADPFGHHWEIGRPVGD